MTENITSRTEAEIMRQVAVCREHSPEARGYDVEAALRAVAAVAKKEQSDTIQAELNSYGLSGVKSGKKMAKKLRQAYGKTFRSLAGERVDSMYKTFEEHIRPKPKLVPTAIWKVIQRVVLMHYV